ncbi:MAG TPA: hypothetical protein VGC98_13155 [Thermoleophilaceae bacterium]
MSLFVGAVGVLLLIVESAPGSRPQLNEIVLWVLAALAGFGIVGLAVGRRMRHGGGRPGGQLLTAAMLAGAALLVLLLVPVHYLAARTHPSPLTWNSYGFLDKRWLTSSFLLLTVGLALLVVIANRVVETARLQPESWRQWLRTLAPARAGAERSGPPEGDPADDGFFSRGRALLALKVVCAIAVATIFFGPPWHLAAAPLDYHETNTMGGVQAIRTGSLPYIDSAAVQYGPGAQVANDLYAAVTGKLSVEGFREVTLIFNWVAAALFLVALFLRASPPVAAAATIAAIALFPTLQFFHVGPKGFVDGFWGWANALRYAGVFVLAMLFPAAVALRRVRSVRVGALALGVLWAALCLVAQENLIGGALVLGIMSLLLVATDTVERRAVVSALLWVAAGFLLIVVPTLLYYAVNGELGRFLELYWLVPSAVASGYSNTAFTNSTWGPYFHVLPVLLGLLLVAALLAGKPLRIASRWSRRRIVLVSALVAALVSHLGALTRSDVSHLKNTELALPAALCLAIFYLPGLLGVGPRRWRWVGGLAVAVLVLALLPSYATEPKKVALRLWRPLHALVDPPSPKRPGANLPPRSVAADRLGAPILHRRQCCTRRSIPTAELVRFMDRLHAVVGARRVYVDGVTAKTVTAPAVYFLADLRPVPTPEDFRTMAFNSRLRAEWFAYFDAHIDGVEAMVARDLRSRAATTWLKRFPKHRTVNLRYGTHAVHVLLR